MKIRRINRGFTLLEVMVALAIIATTLVTLLGTHAMSLNLAYKHKEQTLVGMFARQKMEEVLSMPYDSVESDSGSFGPGHPEYEWELEVEESDIENLKQVSIIIKQPDGEFKLTTLVALDAAE